MGRRKHTEIEKNACRQEGVVIEHLAENYCKHYFVVFGPFVFVDHKLRQHTSEGQVCEQTNIEKEDKGNPATADPFNFEFEHYTQNWSEQKVTYCIESLGEVRIFLGLVLNKPKEQVSNGEPLDPGPNTFNTSQSLVAVFFFYLFVIYLQCPHVKFIVAVWWVKPFLF